MPTNEQISEITRQYKEIIAENGYMIQGVFGCEKTNEPSYRYTIGRTNQGKFDLFCFSELNLNDLIAVIDGMDISKLLSGEIEVFDFVSPGYTIGTMEEKPLARFKLYLCDIEKVKLYAYGLFNTRLVDKPPVGVLQLVLPDTQNLHQGEEGFDPAHATNILK